MENEIIVSEKMEDNLPFARVRNETLQSFPTDLYIPPDALCVILEAFEGPLDLLLYLIRKHNLEILDIPIADVTRQYMEYISLMETFQFELAGEYLAMAATLAEIKSRLLLPRAPSAATGEEADPRAELIRRLQLYEQFKGAAEKLDDLPRLGRDTFSANATASTVQQERPQPDVHLPDLVSALKDVLLRAEQSIAHQITREQLSVREAMVHILSVVRTDSYTDFTQLFQLQYGRLGVVITFLAVLELTRESVIELVQAEIFSPIHVKAL